MLDPVLATSSVVTWCSEELMHESNLLVRLASSSGHPRVYLTAAPERTQTLLLKQTYTHWDGKQEWVTAFITSTNLGLHLVNTHLLQCTRIQTHMKSEDSLKSVNLCGSHVTDFSPPNNVQHILYNETKILKPQAPPTSLTSVIRKQQLSWLTNYNCLLCLNSWQRSCMLTAATIVSLSLAKNDMYVLAIRCHYVNYEKHKWFNCISGWTSLFAACVGKLICRESLISRDKGADIPLSQQSLH